MMVSRKSRARALVAGTLMLGVFGQASAATITYTYDARGRLLTANSTAGRNATYTYDAAGNRTSMVTTGTYALKQDQPVNVPRDAKPVELAVDERAAAVGTAAFIQTSDFIGGEDAMLRMGALTFR